MRVCSIVFGLLVAAVAAMAMEHGPLMTALQPHAVGVAEDTPDHIREKRHLLLGAAGAGLIGAGLLGAGALGAGLLGGGIIGAKAGFIGGALASGAISHGRSYGGYGGYYGGGYYGGGYYGGYGHRYGSYYPSRTYVTYDSYDDWC